MSNCCYVSILRRLSLLLVAFLAACLPPGPSCPAMIEVALDYSSSSSSSRGSGGASSIVRAIGSSSGDTSSGGTSSTTSTSSSRRSSGVAIAVSPAARKNQFIDRTWKNRRTACEKGECAHLDADADAGNNCVYNCTHPACYTEVYGSDPLEPGEVDEKRYNAFVACIRTDLRSASIAAKGRGTEY